MLPTLNSEEAESAPLVLRNLVGRYSGWGQEGYLDLRDDGTFSIHSQGRWDVEGNELRLRDVDSAGRPETTKLVIRGSSLEAPNGYVLLKQEVKASPNTKSSTPKMTSTTSTIQESGVSVVAGPVNLAGGYSDPVQYARLELRNDGTYSMDCRGKWDVKGNELTLVASAATKPLKTLKIRGNTLEDPDDGSVLVRGPIKPASTPLSALAEGASSSSAVQRSDETAKSSPRTHIKLANMSPKEVDDLGNVLIQALKEEGKQGKTRSVPLMRARSLAAEASYDALAFQKAGGWDQLSKALGEGLSGCDAPEDMLAQRPDRDWKDWLAAEALPFLAGKLTGLLGELVTGDEFVKIAGEQVGEGAGNIANRGGQWWGKRASSLFSVGSIAQAW